MLPLNLPQTRRVLMASILLASVFLFGSAPPIADASVPWSDTASRSQVIAAYQAEFSKPTPDPGWTGNRATCASGTTSQTYRNAIFDRINWFRGMAGVPVGVTENASYTAGAQQAALMMSETGQLSHTPSPSFSCYTSAGAAAAGSSNLYLGRTGPDAITGYMFDPGANNAPVGHRNWILHPTTRQMGTGDIPAAGGWASNVLWVFDDVFGPQPALREAEGFVAWPPRGYVPGEVVYPRWSLALRAGDFTSASVSMSRVNADGSTQAVSSPVEFRNGTSGAPSSIIVWQPVGIDTSPAIDTTYRVTVSGVGSGGATKSFTYEVIVIGEQPAQVTNVDYEPFIKNAYKDFLGRYPSANEIADWNMKLNSGTTRYAFVLALAESDEWTAYVIDQMYLDTLGRPADVGGKAYWADRMRNGLTVAEVAAQFYGSPEYLANEGNSYNAWLVDLYSELLYRSPDSGGLNYWLAQVEEKGTSSVAGSFYQSQESRRARVDALFVKLLDRSPDPSGRDYWAEVLLNGDDISLAANLAASAEYSVD